MTAARRLITVQEAAARTTIAPATWYCWAKLGKGPRSFKLGGRRVYDEAEFEAWIDAQAEEAQR